VTVTVALPTAWADGTPLPHRHAPPTIDEAAIVDEPLIDDFCDDLPAIVEISRSPPDDMPPDSPPPDDPPE
jgi:hypothetical protein